MEPVLDITGLTVSLPEKADRAYAIEDIALQVSAGEIVCVVGESGSGKSVMSFAVMGLQDKSALKTVAGEILLEGRNLLDLSDAEIRKLRGEKMAMIFQEPMTALNPVVPVGRQVDELLTIHTTLSSSERKARVLRVLEDVHLPDPEKIYRSFPHQLSGGQRQRIVIAMALILEPVLLIADEPTTALDVTTQAQILSLIKELQASRGMGVMFITHDFGVVADIADRVVVMQEGLIVETGTVEAVLGDPQHAYTKMLIGSVPSIVPPARAEATGPVALTTRKLNKRFGRRGILARGRVVQAAKDVDLYVRRGETLGIVGESGSGKSTVARCILRLIDPTSGEIEIGNAAIAEISEGKLRRHRRDFQMIFQDPYRSLNPRRTVGQSIIEGPVNFGIGRAEAVERAQRLMSFVGLSPDVLERFPHQFSGGQRQRICVARALAMEPSVLVADEAVSALDVSVQGQVLDLLKRVRKKFELAMLFITHDLRVAAQVCDRIMVMKMGNVVETGSTAEIFANPQHDYTKALFAATPGKRRLGAV